MESYEAVKKSKVRVLSGELSETSEKGIGAWYVCFSLYRQFFRRILEKVVTVVASGEENRMTGAQV